MPGYATSDVDYVRYFEFAKRIILLGEPPAVAAKNVGWQPKRGRLAMRTEQYRLARSEIISQYRAQIDGFTNDLRHMLEETAFVGVSKLNRAVKKKDISTEMLKDVTSDALDRVGARVQKHDESVVRVELGPETLALLRKGNAEYDQVREIKLDEGPLGYALERPAIGTDAVAEKVGKDGKDGDSK